MTYIFDEYRKRYRFNTFRNTVLRHETTNYFRELNHQRIHTTYMDSLSYLAIFTLENAV